MRRPETRARDFVGHVVSTVPTMGWAGIKNGALLALAEKEFEVFVTVDRKISVEQDLKKFKIVVVLLRAQTNRLEDIGHSRSSCSKNFLALPPGN